MLKSFNKYVTFVLLIIFLVIIAGSVVRTTQSGMGCPDWPKCFGQYIPPTQMEQVLFQPNKKYTKGQFIRYNDSLWSASETFISNINFEPKNWKHYTKHGYTKIVIHQTWIEFINRLLGALLGIFVFIQAVWSIRFWKHRKMLFWLSALVVLLTGVQAWLGKTVVDSNLAVLKISIHLVGALLLCFLQVYILYLINPKKTSLNKIASVWLQLFSLGATVQFFMGVIIRQKIDVIAETNNYVNRQTWLNDIGTVYYIHRTFSLVLLGICFYIYKKGSDLFQNNFKPIPILMVLQLVIGILFTYANFPAVVQPLHLTIACIQITYLWYLQLIKKITVP